MDMVEPTRDIVLNAKAEPMCAKSSNEKVEPMRDMPKSAKVEPIRAKLRRDTDEPKLKKSSTDS
jgi:hypothetical protein